MWYNEHRYVHFRPWQRTIQKSIHEKNIIRTFLNSTQMKTTNDLLSENIKKHKMKNEDRNTLCSLAPGMH